MRTEVFTVEAVWPADLDLTQVVRKIVVAIISFHSGPVAAVAGLLPPGLGFRKTLLVVYTPKMLPEVELSVLLHDSVASAVHAVDASLDLDTLLPIAIDPVELVGVTRQGAAAIESTFSSCEGLAWGGDAELLPVGLSKELACRREPSGDVSA